MALKKKKNSKKPAKKTIKKARKKTKKPIKKSLKKRLAPKKPARAKPASVKKEGNLIGLVTHYFPHVRAAVIKLKKPLAIGESIKVQGHTTNFTQTIDSIQINRTDIKRAKTGDVIGFQVCSRVRRRDKVYKI